jgi:hypothetical protein
MSFDHTTVKLGKKDARFDPRTLKFADFTTTYVPPSSAAYGLGLTYAMDGNDQYGDCGVAAFAHQVQVWNSLTDRSFAVGEAQCIAAYEVLCPGFNPVTDANDNGTDLLTNCQYWKSHGIDDPASSYGRDQISAYMSVDPTNTMDVEQSIAQFGGLYLGVQLPISAQSQVGSLWTVTSGRNAEPGSWGGHAIPVISYDPDKLCVVTWGALQYMTWDFLYTYGDESYCLLSRNWFAGPASGSGLSPSGFSFGKLKAALANL